MEDAKETQLGLWELNIGGVHPVRTATLVRQEDASGLQFKRNARAVSLGFWKNLKSAFLPEGYPNSVTADYLPFQTWDTLQGLSTYIRSMLSTQALLGGIGVGETKATVVGATFQWFLRDFTGMLGGILFTLYQGSNLDSSAKQWRLAADFLNDMGMLMDLISPLFPGSFLTILCIGSVARAITGTASGATRAALTQHFAVRQNAADVQAKEGSQETAATMVGMLLGMVVARATAGDAVAMWVSFLVLTAFHMYANYRAVRSLCLTSLNPERTEILLRSHLRQETVDLPTPKEMSVKERVLPQLPGQRLFAMWRPGICWRISFGSRISSLRPRGGWESFTRILIHQYGRQEYMVSVEDGVIHVILNSRASVQDCLRAYVHALRLKEILERSQTGSADTTGAERDCLAWMESSYSRFLNLLQQSGWVNNRIHISASEWRADWPEQSSGTGKLDSSSKDD
ncbi:unnamed protein product [Calypogeia fissa]